MKKIAVREEKWGDCVIWHDPKDKSYSIQVRNVMSGPYTLKELSSVRENIADVISQDGRYLFIETEEDTNV